MMSVPAPVHFRQKQTNSRAIGASAGPPSATLHGTAAGSENQRGVERSSEPGPVVVSLTKLSQHPEAKRRRQREESHQPDQGKRARCVR